MRKRLPALCCFLVLMFTIIVPTYVYADVGPKPSVVIDFEGLENEEYYVTLLSEKRSTGPYWAYNEEDNMRYYYEEYGGVEVFEKFLSFKDEDGYYFLQFFQDCTDTSRFSWTYYPPYKFKILIYFPNEDTFAVSYDTYERYAFDSYFKVDASNLNIEPRSTIGGISAVKNYDYTWELISLFARIIATIVIEFIIALIFGFRTKKQLLIIAGVNIFTQTVLNILLNIVNYNHGSMMFAIWYVLLELLVIIIEAITFYFILNKFSIREVKVKWLALIYALAANIVSFGLGFFLAKLIPGIF